MNDAAQAERIAAIHDFIMGPAADDLYKRAATSESELNECVESLLNESQEFGWGFTGEDIHIAVTLGISRGWGEVS